MYKLLKLMTIPFSVVGAVASAGANKVGDLIDHHKLITRSILLWLVLMITYTISKAVEFVQSMLEKTAAIDSADMAIVIGELLGTIAVLAGVFTPLFLLYKYLRGKDYESEGFGKGKDDE